MHHGGLWTDQETFSAFRYGLSTTYPVVFVGSAIDQIARVFESHWDHISDVYDSVSPGPGSTIVPGHEFLPSKHSKKTESDKLDTISKPDGFRSKNA